jgi:hypothetical protein
MTRAVARAATTGDVDLAPVRSSRPGRRLSDVGELIEVLMRRLSLGLSLPSSTDFDDVSVFEEMCESGRMGGRVNWRGNSVR